MAFLLQEMESACKAPAENAPSPGSLFAGKASSGL